MSKINLRICLNQQWQSISVVTQHAKSLGKNIMFFCIQTGHSLLEVKSLWKESRRRVAFHSALTVLPFSLCAARILFLTIKEFSLELFIIIFKTCVMLGGSIIIQQWCMHDVDKLSSSKFIMY